MKKLFLLLILVSICTKNYTADQHALAIVTPANPPQDVADALEIMNRDGQTPLAIAIAQKNSGAVACLLQAGASANYKDFSDQTPLHQACKHLTTETTGESSELVEIMKLLIGYGAQVNAQDSSSRTPLHIIAKEQYQNPVTCAHAVAAIKLLRDNEALCNITDGSQNTPLHSATSNGNIAIMKALCS